MIGTMQNKIDSAIANNWDILTLPTDLLEHPLVAHKQDPALQLILMIFSPLWFVDAAGILAKHMHASAVYDQSRVFIKKKGTLEYGLRRIEYLREELGLLNPVTLYLEAHITIEPVFDDRRATAEKMAKIHTFKLADLLMKKRKEDTEERSDKDTFMTGHSKNYQDLAYRTIALVNDLTKAGFKVWRYKIENTICDSRSDNIFNLDLAVVNDQRPTLEQELASRSPPNYAYINDDYYVNGVLQERKPT